jgi:hypothetical protein
MAWVGVAWVGVAWVGDVGVLRPWPGELLDDGIALRLDDDPLDLRVLVIEGDGEAGAVPPHGLVLRPGKGDVPFAVGVPAFAEVDRKRLVRAEAVGGSLDPFIGPPGADLAAALRLSPVVIHGGP